MQEGSSESERESRWKERWEAMLREVSPQAVAESPFVYADRRLVAMALTRIKMFEKILDVQGSIVECGVHRGNSLMLYYHLSSILEPVAFNRKIIGFDTFAGFPSVSSNDPAWAKVGRFSDTNKEHIQAWSALQDQNRPVGHIPKIELVSGDACKTIPEYVKENPHLIIAFLYLDFDLYEPTKVALTHLLPLVPKGGLVGFDEISQKKYAGETIAMKESIRVSGVHLRKFGFDPHVSYYVVG